MGFETNGHAVVSGVISDALSVNNAATWDNAMFFIRNSLSLSAIDHTDWPLAWRQDRMISAVQQSDLPAPLTSAEAA